MKTIFLVIIFIFFPLCQSAKLKKEMPDQSGIHQQALSWLHNLEASIFSLEQQVKNNDCNLHVIINAYEDTLKTWETTKNQVMYLTNSFPNLQKIDKEILMNMLNSILTIAYHGLSQKLEVADQSLLFDEKIIFFEDSMTFLKICFGLTNNFFHQNSEIISNIKMQETVKRLIELYMSVHFYRVNAILTLSGDDLTCFLKQTSEYVGCDYADQRLFEKFIPACLHDHLIKSFGVMRNNEALLLA